MSRKPAYKKSSAKALTSSPRSKAVPPPPRPELPVYPKEGETWESTDGNPMGHSLRHIVSVSPLDHSVQWCYGSHMKGMPFRTSWKNWRKWSKHARRIVL